MIRVTDFHKAYPGTLAVQSVSFSVAPGQILGLIGPNGAGKTTTLRAISGILSPSRGTISICDHDMSSDPLAAKAKLAYMPDQPQLYDALTAVEHLQFVAATHRLTAPASRITSLLEEFALTEKQHVAAEHLSRGMRQKLAICCGYLADPSAILFDEPLTGLDPLAIRRLKESIRRQAERGAAVIVSSHLLDVVDDLCSSFLILHQGQTRFCGTRDELRSHVSPDRASSLEEAFFQLIEA